MLVNILQHTGQSPRQRITQPRCQEHQGGETLLQMTHSHRLLARRHEKMDETALSAGARHSNPSLPTPFSQGQPRVMEGSGPGLGRPEFKARLGGLRPCVWSPRPSPSQASRVIGTGCLHSSGLWCGPRGSLCGEGAPSVGLCWQTRAPGLEPFHVCLSVSDPLGEGSPGVPPCPYGATWLFPQGLLHLASCFMCSQTGGAEVSFWEDGICREMQGHCFCAV